MGCGCNKKKEDFVSLRQAAINRGAIKSPNLIDKTILPQPKIEQPKTEDRFKGMSPRQIKITLRAERIQNRVERIKARNQNIRNLELKRQLAVSNVAANTN